MLVEWPRLGVVASFVIATVPATYYNSILEFPAVLLSKKKKNRLLLTTDITFSARVVNVPAKTIVFHVGSTSGVEALGYGRK